MMEIIKTILGILFIIVLIFAFEKLREKQKLKKLRIKRPGLSKKDYIKALELKGFFKEDIEVVYEKLKEFIAEDSFLLHPEDDIHKDYDIVDLDDIELINQVCDSLNIPQPDDYEYELVNKIDKNFTVSYILNLIIYIKEKLRTTMN